MEKPLNSLQHIELCFSKAMDNYAIFSLFPQALYLYTGYALFFNGLALFYDLALNSFIWRFRLSMVESSVGSVRISPSIFSVECITVV